MRIGYVLKKFPRISETFILNEILELERQGVEVTVFSLHAPDDGLFHANLSRLRDPVVYLPQPKSQALLERLRGNVTALREGQSGIWSQLESLLVEGRTDVWQVLRWGVEIALQVRERGIDRIHAHFATVAAYAARAAHAVAGVPYSFTCHAKDIYRDGVDPERFQRLAAPADFVVTVCEANRRHILENLAGPASLSVVSLYNGVDLDWFNPRNRAPDGEPLVLGVGRLVQKKGFEHLISAAGNLLRAGANLRCVIVGEGEERERLEAEVRRQATDRIELPGLRTQEEVRQLLARATVLALPCVIGEDGNRDALPTVLLEAMAAGVPVISTPVVGVEEILDEGRAGVLVPTADVGALERAIGRLLRDGDERRELARGGRARAELLFDLRRNVGTLRQWFQSGVARPEVCR